MSVSGSRPIADINLDEFERRLRAAASFPTGAEDPLYELARLVEAAEPKPSVRVGGQPAGPVQPPLEAGALRPALEEAEYHGDIDAEAEDPHAAAYSGPDAGDRPAPRERRRAFGWKAKASALAVAGVAMIGAVLALKGGVPGVPKQPPYIAAAQGPIKVAPPSDEAVSAPSDAGASLLKDNTQSAHVKVVASEEQPVDLSALNSPSSSLAAPAAANPPPDASGPAVRETVDAPLVVPKDPPPPATSQFPEPKPVRTVSLRPDGTLIPTPAVAEADASAAAPVVETPAQPAKPSSKATAEAPAVPQASTPKIELPTKLGKSSARVAVAKTDTTAPGSTAEAANEPASVGSTTKPEKAAKASKPQVASAEPATAAEPAQTADAASATKSSGWSVQLAAPRSEAEANSELTRLNAKYASALNGSVIGVHKAVIKGETIYRLRVVGLSKADAAAMCARLKGDGGDCFIAR